MGKCLLLRAIVRIMKAEVYGFTAYGQETRMPVRAIQT